MYKLIYQIEFYFQYGANSICFVGTRDFIASGISQLFRPTTTEIAFNPSESTGKQYVNFRILEGTTIRIANNDGRRTYDLIGPSMDAISFYDPVSNDDVQRLIYGLDRAEMLRQIGKSGK